MALVIPTTNKLYPVAATGFILNRKTIIGTVRMEPPLPNTPSEIPTSMAQTNPITSINEKHQKNQTSDNIFTNGQL